MANKTFWNIITEYEIEIPQLQRDYAQGRNTTAIKQIRESLISEIFNSLVYGNKLVLNFIYGEREQGSFVPIDGQQRLTTLFLVHWYVFKQAGNQNGIKELSNFSYSTRNSSKRFCTRLLGVDIDFSHTLISDQIQNSSWYSGHFTNDPTIQSMLVVIDEIHRQFKGVNDFDVISNILICNDCPITFLWQPMDNFQKRDDLYIKMNARGKLLTDFEIFKAKLQKSNTLSLMFRGNATNAQKLEFISRYNNDYAELFYRYYKSEFDDAMMSFIKAIMRDEYFSQACINGVTQKEYRNRYKEPITMNGNVFFNFMETGGYNFSRFDYEIGKNAFVGSLVKIDALLNMFSEYSEKLEELPVISERHYNDLKLFKINFKEGTDADNFAKNALYEYLYKFGFPDSQDELAAYSMWKRFVYNIVTNTDVAGHVEYICDAIIVIKQIVNNIYQTSAQPTEKIILDVVSSYNENEHISGIKCQLDEEKLKSSLISSDQKWRSCIFAAEKYFYDGQIGFLLDYSKRKTGVPEISEFIRGLNISKKIFQGSKQVKEDCDPVLFEQALLIMKDDTDNQTAHLIKQSNSTTSWGFCRNDYKKLLANSTEERKKRIVFELFDLLSENLDINIELRNIIAEKKPDISNSCAMWKCYFVDNNLFDVDMQYSQTHSWNFNNCINLGNNNNEVLMLIGTTVRSYSMELKTYLLYKKLIENGVNCMLHLDTTGDIKENGFPRRYIICNQKYIAFNGDNLTSDCYLIKHEDGTIEMSYCDAILNMFI